MKFSSIGMVRFLALFLFSAAETSSYATTYTWSNPSSGSWNTAANWTPNGVPADGDIAVITIPGVTVSLTSASAVSGLTVGASMNCTVPTVFSLNNQSFLLDGPLVVGSCGQFTVDSGTLIGTNNASLSGGVGWTAGALTGTLTLNTNCLFTILTPNDHDMPNCILTNFGTVAWTNGTIRGGSNPGTFVYNYGLWDSQSDQIFNNAFGGNIGTIFYNFSTLQKSGGTNSTVFQGEVLVNQTAGQLNAISGSLVLQGNGNFLGGTVTSSTNGAVYLSEGNFNINGATTTGNVIENAGELTGTNVINGTLSWVAGYWDGAVVTIATNSTVVIAGGNNNNDMQNAVVTNYGTVAWASGTLRGGGNSSTFVYNYGLWDSQSDEVFNNAFGGTIGTIFYNFSTLQKSGGTNSTVFQGGVLLNQTAGLANAISGSLVLQGNGNFLGGTVTSSTNGAVYLSEGNFNINGATTTGNVIENAGELTGTNVISGTLSWVAGYWDGAVVTIATNSTVVIAGGGNNNDMQDTLVTNYGTVAWASGTLRGGGNPGTFVYNYGLWDSQSDEVFNNAFGGSIGTIFYNFSTLQKSGGTNSTTFQGGVLLNQTAGLANAISGSLVLQGNGNFYGGTVTSSPNGTVVLSEGNFNINGAFTSGNVVENTGYLVGTNIINGTLTWIGGVWDGAVVTIATNSTVVIAGGGNNNDMQNTLVTNYGTVAWASGTLRGGGNPGTFVYNYGLWDSQSDEVFNNNFGGSIGTIFYNFGTLQKSAGTNSTVLQAGVLLNQTAGLANAISGSLVLQGNGNFLGGTVTSSTNGTVVLSEGNFNINGSTTTGNVVENAGNLTGTNVISGILSWVGGYWDGAIVTIATNSTVVIAGGGNNNDLLNTVVTNNGTVAWASGTLRGGSNPGTFVYNYGLWDSQSDEVFNNAFGGNIGTVFYNYGRFRKSVGTNSTTFQASVAFNNTGILDVQMANVSLQGGYSLTNGTFNFGLNSLSNFGTLSLSGTAPLTGVTLSANLTHGYVPMVSNAFKVLLFGSSTGFFSYTNLPRVAIWQTLYDPTDVTILVLKLVPTISVTNPVTITYGTPLSTNLLNATAANPGNLSTNLPGTFTYSTSLGTVLNAGSNQTLTVTFTPIDTADFSTNSTTITINVQKAPLLITANNLFKTYGSNLTFVGNEYFTTGLTNGDTVASVSLSSTGSPATASVSGSPYAIIVSNALPATLTNNYNITYQTGQLTVLPASLTVTANNASSPFGAPLPAFSAVISGFVNGQSSNVVSGVPAFLTSGTSSSPVGSYIIVPTLGTLSASNYQFTNFVSGLLTITPVAPIVTFTNPAPIVQGTSLGSNQLDATASVPGTFVYTPTLGTVLNVGSNQIISVRFTPTDTKDYTSITTNAFITVLAGGSCDQPPAGLISWYRAESNAFDLVGGNNGTLANGVSYVPGEVGHAFNLNSNSAMVLIGSATNLQLQTFTIEGWFKRGSPAIATLDPQAVAGNALLFSYGQNGYGFGINSNGTLLLSQIGVGGVYSSTTVTDTNFHHLAVTKLGGRVVFYIDGVANLASGSFNPPFTFATTAAIGGRADNLNAPNNDSFLGAIDELSIYGRALASNEIQGIYNAGSAGKCLPGVTLTWTNPADITYGTPLGSNQLNATANIAGTFAYTPTFGTVLNAGSNQPLSVLFTPTDTNDFSTASATVYINVHPATPVITWTNPTSIVYGTPLGSNQLNATANVGGTFVYTPTAGTVLNSGAGQLLSVVFTPTNIINYTMASNSVLITVTMAPLSVTASNATRVFGAPNPVFTGSIVGLTNGDNITASYSTIANASSAPGPYPIVPVLVDPNNRATNYTVTLNNGILTVTQAPSVGVTCPNNIVTNAASNACSQVVSFAATATGSPTPTLTYQYLGALITSPFSFPVGTNTVNTTASNSSGTMSCSFTVTVIDLTPPVPGTNLLGTAENKATVFSVAKMLLNAKNPRGGTLTVTSVGTMTTNGGAVILGSGQISYAPAPNFIGQDTINYTLSDGCGSAPGTVSVTVTSTNLPSLNVVSITVIGSNRVVVFCGIPGHSYIVQSAPGLGGPWTNLSGPIVAASNGLIQYSDTTTPMPAQRFYRTVVAPQPQ